MRLPCSVLAVALAACGTDSDSTCTSAITYSTVGQPYMESWCNGCHSADLPPNMRQLAPANVNFDTLDEIRGQLLPIQMTIQTGTMPPEGGPNAQDQMLVLQWLGCGAP